MSFNFWTRLGWFSGWTLFHSRNFQLVYFYQWIYVTTIIFKNESFFLLIILILKQFLINRFTFPPSFKNRFKQRKKNLFLIRCVMYSYLQEDLLIMIRLSYCWIYFVLNLFISLMCFNIVFLLLKFVVCKFLSNSQNLLISSKHSMPF